MFILAQSWFTVTELLYWLTNLFSTVQEFLDKEDEEEEATESKVLSFQIKQKEIENVQRRFVILLC